MQDFIIANYPWFRALHIMAVMAWMAGLFYLPRLYVYHAATKVGSEQSETFKVMERRLLRAIMNPAMIASWLFGLAMLWANPALFGMGWIHVKLTAVILMTVLHGLFARNRKQFERDANPHGHVYYRVMNEMPTVLMIVIVIMAIVQPF